MQPVSLPRKILGLQQKMHLLLAEWVSLDRARRQSTSAMVSFTFDDFPRSALGIGGRMLSDHGWRGTYYCASGMMGKIVDSEAMFTRSDLDNLVAAGHELGCHTRDHVPCFSRDGKSFAENCAANRSGIKKMLGYDIRNFSFPNGQATLGVKRRLHSVYDSCRSNNWGINTDPVDLSYLRANPIYSRYGTEAVRKLVAENVQRNGWLVLYTHDISPNPSPYGCTPDDFEQVMHLVLESSAEVVTIRDAVSRFARI